MDKLKMKIITLKSVVVNFSCGFVLAKNEAFVITLNELEKISNRKVNMNSFHVVSHR